MPIPAITPYPMPPTTELPSSAVPWRPDASRAALLVHDMQRYFLGFFALDQPPVPELLANLGRLRAAAAALGVPVVYTAQPGDMDHAQRGLLRDLWGEGMAADGHANAIVPELAPAPGDPVVTKWRYSAFHSTTLGNVLRRLGRDQLLIGGVYAHVGCLMTACDAFELDIEPFLVADAVADFSEEDHRMGLAYAARRCAAVVTTAQALAALSPHPETGDGPPDQADAIA